MGMPLSYCSPRKVVELLKSETPFALIDVREQEEYSRRHILRASNVPLSRLEFLIFRLVPCKKVPLVLVGSGEENDKRALHAFLRMESMGYDKLSILKKGIAGWKRAGRVLVGGTSCMAKGYAECLERAMNTPGVTPAEIRRRLADGENMALIDIREPEEYNVMAIPGGINAPGCEAAYRFFDLAPDPDTLVVTNCGSRTRGILCAQMLIDFGVPNPVASMTGGTLNWKLSGFPLEFQRTDRTAAPSFAALEAACQRAGVLARNHGVSLVDAATVRQWQSEAEDRPMYIFDVRQPEEYAAGHMPGSRCAPGGQLVQLSDDFAAIRHARVVLVDDTEVRAIITAYWLDQVAFPHVHVLKGGIGGSGICEDRRMEYGPEPLLPIQCSHEKSMSAEELARTPGPEFPLVINVGYSDRHRQGHVPGAVWGSRCWLERAQARYPDAEDIVITADCEAHARLAAGDARELWPRAGVRFLAGGNEAWRRKDLPLEEGMPSAFCAEDDIWYLAYKDPGATAEVMEEFFDWKLKLAGQVEKDGTFAFRLPVKK